MPINTVIHTNSHSIDRVLNAGVPVLLVFWSYAAHQQDDYQETLESLAQRYAGKALVAKINTDDEAELVKRFDVRLLPTIIPIREGRAQVTLAGKVDDAIVDAWLMYLVKGGAQPAAASGPGIPTATGKPLGVNGSSHQHAAGPATAQTGRSQSAQQTTVGPVTITDATFDQVINGSVPVLVDFWAEWCGPCRMVAPSVEQLAHEFAGRAIVGKLNVDHNMQTARRFNIMSIPALYIFKQGQVVDRIVGAQPVDVLRRRLAAAVGA